VTAFVRPYSKLFWTSSLSNTTFCDGLLVPSNLREALLKVTPEMTCTWPRSSVQAPALAISGKKLTSRTSAAVKRSRMA
jgi:hypothetical protein